MELSELEGRVLLSAVPAATAAQPADAAPVDAADQVQPLDQTAGDVDPSNTAGLDVAEVARLSTNDDSDPNSGEFGDGAEAESGELRAESQNFHSTSSSAVPHSAFRIPHSADSQLTHELVFIDTSVAGYQQLLEDLWAHNDDGRQLDVVLLSNQLDGIDQIGEALARYDRLDAVHIVSHGTDGAVKLGSSWLNLDNVGAYAGQLVAWRDALATDADLMVYGCDLAETGDGRTLIESLGTLTGADVAASIDATGHALLGGDWELEYRSGRVEADIPFTRELVGVWYHTLDINTGLVGHWDLDADASDASGNSFHGTLAGDAKIDPNPATNHVGPGKLSLDGTDDYVDLGARAAKLGSLSQGTIAGWIRTSHTIGGQTLFGIADHGDPVSFATFGVWNDRLFFDVAENGYLMTSYTDAVVADGTWHHVAVTVDGSGNRFYIDGAQVDTADINYGAGASPSSTYFLSSVNNVDQVAIGVTGESGGYAYDFQGLIDDVRVYDRALTAGDITSLYKLGVDNAPVIDLDTDDSSGATGADFVTTWTQGGGAVSIADVDALISDADSAQLETVQIEITNLADVGDEWLLADTTGTSINLIWDPNNGILRLSGADTVAHFNQVLQTVSYHNTAASPDTTARVITFIGQDTSANPSNTATATVNMSGPTTHDISGTIYEDINGDADLGDAVGVNKATVLLYRDGGDNRPDGVDDTFVTSVFTDAGGDYTFTGQTAGKYWVVVDSTSITPAAGFIGVGHSDDVWAEQTYGIAYAMLFDGSNYTALGSPGAMHGGMRADVSDDASTLAGSEHVTAVALGAADVTGVNSAFSFTAITRTGDGDDDPAADRSVQGSLRQFIQNSNAINGVQSSQFAISTGDSGYNGTGNGEYTIQVLSGLPTITDSVTIDGTTQTGYIDKPIIELDGSGAGAGVDGFFIDSTSNVTLRGLVINRFDGNAVHLFDSDNAVIEGNYIGTDVTGTLARSNIRGIWFQFGSSGNTIGGTTATSRNVISGNKLEGMVLEGGGVTGNFVQGNYIGTTADGATALGNGTFGISLSSGADNNTIGGTAPGAGNVIAYNGGIGVNLFNPTATGNTILRNEIYGNTGLGIDLNGGTEDGFGVTANDADDSDTGANNLQNYPVLSSAVTDGGTTVTIDGTLAGTASTNFRIEFFASSAVDPSGYGEAERYLGHADVTTDGSGNATFSVPLSVSVNAGEFVTATATDAAGNTSEFGLSVEATEVDITSDLVMHLMLDDGSGGTADDATANNNDGILNGNAAWTAGEIGGGVAFDYTDGDDYIQVPNSPTLENVQENNYTLAAWFRPDSTPPGSDSDSDANYGIMIKVGWHTGLYYGNDNRFYFQHAFDGDSTEWAVSTNTFAPGEFHHVAGVLDRAAGTMHIYVDGQHQGTNTFTPGRAPREYGTNTWKLGVANAAGGDWSWPADGAIDDARIYSRALSADDVAALHDLSPGNDAPTDLVATSTASGGLSINEDGGNDAYFIADDGDAVFGGRTALTAEVRFAMDSFTNSTHFLSYATATDSDTFRFGIQNNGTFRILVNGNYVESSAMDYRTLADGQQHTLSVTWDSSGGLWEIFADGVSVDSGSGHRDGATLYGGGTLVFGNEQDSIDGGYDLQSVVSATLYDFRVFDTVRSDVEIAANYDSTLPFDETGLVANWTFNDLSTDGVITDAVSSNNLALRHASGTGFLPSDPTLTLEVDENALNGTVVGTVTGIDPNAGDTLSYLLTDDAGGRFAIDADNGQITVADGSLLDHETNATHTVTVRVTDVGGGTYDEDVSITIRDRNDAPLAVDDPANVDEDNSVMVDVVANDTDPDGDPLTVLGFERVVAEYDAGTAGPAPDPASVAGGNWTFEDTEDGDPAAGHLTAGSISPDGGTGQNGWNVTDASETAGQFVRYHKALSPADAALADASGWSLKAEMRMVDDYADTRTAYLRYGNGTTRFLAWFDLDANGDLQVELADDLGSQFITVTSGGTGTDEYHTFEIVYDPVTATAAFLVDGVRRDDGNWAGESSSYDGVRWGTGSGEGQGSANFHSVQMKVFDQSITTAEGATVTNNGDGTVTYTPAGDFHGADSFTYTIRDTDGHLDSATVNITVDPVNDAPQMNNLGFGELENAPNGTWIGTLAATDPDVGDTLTFSVTGGTGATAFSVNPTTGEITVADTSQLDYETTTSFALQVQVTDNGTPHRSDTAIITINVLDDPDEFDVTGIGDVDPADNSVAENAVVGTAVGITAFADDADLIDAVTYNLENDAGGRFSIDAASGVIRLAGGLDYETATSHSVTVRATSTDGSSTTRAFTIGVTDVNDNAPQIGDQAFSVDEHRLDGTVVGTIVASDEDLGDTLTFTVDGGDPAGVFHIDPGTGTITVARSVDLVFESQNRYQISVDVVDNSGQSDTAVITIDLLNVDTPPSTAADTYEMEQGQTLTVPASGVLANDIDVDGDAVAAVLVSSPAHGDFHLAADGSFTYTPNNDFFGTDTFAYRSTDGIEDGAEVTVVIEVHQATLPPQPDPLDDDPDPEDEPDDEDDDAADEDEATDDDGSAPAPTPPPAVDINPEPIPIGPPDPPGGMQNPPDSDPDGGVFVAAVSGESGVKTFYERDSAIDNATRPLVPWHEVRSGNESTPARSHSVSSFNTGLLWGQLDTLEEDMLQKVGSEQFVHKLVVGTTAAGMASLTVGYVIWLIRGGTLLATMISALPAWMAFDPLPVLDSFEDRENAAHRSRGTNDERWETMLG